MDQLSACCERWTAHSTIWVAMMPLPSSIQKRATKRARCMAETTARAVDAAWSALSRSHRLLWSWERRSMSAKGYTGTYIAGVGTTSLLSGRPNADHTPRHQPRYAGRREKGHTPKNIVISDLPTAAFLLDACTINPTARTNDSAESTTSAEVSATSPCVQAKRHCWFYEDSELTDIPQTPSLSRSSNLAARP